MTILTEKQIWRRSPEPQFKERQLGNRLTLDQRANVRAALIYLVGRHESREAAAAALGMSFDALHGSMRRTRAQTYRLACIVARAAGTPVEQILSG